MLEELLLNQLKQVFWKSKRSASKSLASYFQEWEPDWNNKPGTKTRHGGFTLKLRTFPEGVVISIGGSLVQTVPSDSCESPEEAIERGFGMMYERAFINFEHNNVREEYQIAEEKKHEASVLRKISVTVETLCGGKVSDELGFQTFGAPPYVDPIRPDLSMPAKPSMIEESEMRNLIRLISSSSLTI
ncbi:MAG: hypothetical protein KGI60_00415 [Patescibacteria group bacterium]|nr:hypothetical protein [Patescibacteria group bacterium]